MGAGEIILTAVLGLILFSASVLLRPTIQTPDQFLTAFKLWVAQGFGVGRIPFAPGTAGSLIGLLWFALLLASGRFWIFLGGMLVGLALSVRWCDVAEKSLGQ